LPFTDADLALAKLDAPEDDARAVSAVDQVTKDIDGLILTLSADFAVLHQFAANSSIAPNIPPIASATIADLGTLASNSAHGLGR
jgi:hypothetical protein